jgi:hypothetical protein
MEQHEMTSPKETQTKKQENVFLSLIFNLILPVLILQKGSKLGFEGSSTIALIVALAFPFFYGVHDYLKNKNKNIISIIGVINILITGVFAIAQFEGHWFAIKEAAIPLVLGVGVLFSIRMNKPFMQFMLFQSGAFKKELLEEKIAENNNQEALKKQLNFSTYLLSISFFLSSIMNYVLALRIFEKIDSQLTLEQQKEILNHQIANMNWMGMVVISVPLLFFLGFIMWNFFRNIKKLSGLSIEDLIQS